MFLKSIAKLRKQRDAYLVEIKNWSQHKHVFTLKWGYAVFLIVVFVLCYK